MNMQDVKFGIGRTGLILNKYSPEILLGAGLVGMVITIILASKAALEVHDIVADTKTELEVIEDNADNSDNDKYSIEAYRKDVVTTYGTATLKFAKLYAPTIGVGIASTACILASRGIMANRNAVLISAYNLMAEGYKNYRERVADEFGEEKDRMFHQGFEEKFETEVVDGEDGKKIKNKVRKLERVSKAIPSIYARFFDESSAEWRTSRDLNAYFLRTVQTHVNDRFRGKGHMFLNEVYDEIGIPRSLEGQMVGWIYSKNNPVGDNYIDFGIFDANNPASRDFVNGYNPSVLLDFNVDGVIADLMFRKGRT